MKNLHFDYAFYISYTADVNRCYYTIKSVPQDSARQKIKHFDIEMDPQSNPEWGYDSLGNRYIWGCNEKPHKDFMFHLTGDAVCGLADYEEVATENEAMIYRHGTRFTNAGESLLAFFAKCEEEGKLSEMDSALKKADFLMEKLQAKFTYEKEVTDVETTAEEAFSNGKGVCQDYAHILISLLLLAGCSSRYVTGFTIGEGATHAWVEVLSEGKWYGYDPTAGTRVADAHIKIGVGRDASECQINRGIMHGGGRQGLVTKLSVTESGQGADYLRKGLM